MCKSFTYEFRQFEFVPLSSNTTIIFAFQQASGYWDIDDITLWDSNGITFIFQNGDFESGSLVPDYQQCQSRGNISNNHQFHGQYCYSDGTQGQFGYLMQRVSVTGGARYYLKFFVQNRNGLNSGLAILLAN